jgi:hypothetical protein
MSGLVIALCMVLGCFVVGLRSVLVMLRRLLVHVMCHNNHLGEAPINASENLRRLHAGKHRHRVKIQCRFAPFSPEQDLPVD